MNEHRESPFRQKHLITRVASLLLILFFVGHAAGQGLADLSKPIYVRWAYKTDSLTNLTPGVDSERIYLPLTNGSIISVSLANGKLSWRSEIGGVISASPVADAKSV